MKGGLRTPLVLILAAAGAAAGEPGLVNVRPIFRPDELGEEAKLYAPLGPARLSPDGRRLLYVRCRENAPKPENHRGPWPQRLYKVVLRELATGKEKVLPCPAWTWDDLPAMLLAREVFSPDGGKIVLGAGIDADGNGIFEHRREKTQPMVYDVATGKARRLPVTDQFVLSAYTPDGKEILIATWSKRERKAALYLTPADKAAPRKLPPAGIPMNVCPSARIVPLWVPPKGDPEEGRWRFVLHDLAADTPLCELPTHPKNTSLDDFTPQWTSGGRFLYYVDVEVSKQPSGTHRKRITRVWDRLAGKEATVLDEAVAVGPGPTPTTMVLRHGAGLVLHDAAAGATAVLARGALRPLFAARGKLVYLQKQQGKWSAFIADIAMPAATRPAGKPK